VAGLQFAAGAQPFLVTYLLRRLREEPDAVCGILAGPKELEAIDILTADHQIDPARIRTYRQDGEAATPSDKEPSELYGVPGPDRPARERWDFWTGQFARCLRCNACREGCPLCTCLRCVTDKTRPRWIDASPTPAGNWLWNITRAFHQAGRCIDCGGCTAACPAGIPLGALNLAMARAADRAFGPRLAGEGGRRSPLLAYRSEDQAPFIM
jgi:ferredoxin